jgi:FkbM family methyltransferase
VKIFLDVGAHAGWTLMAVRDPKYRFDRIYCFEPASACWQALERLADRRVTICRFGLWNTTTARPLYDAGSRSASLYADKFEDARAEEDVQLVRATDWFREHLRDGDEVYVKLNCEGAEADIVEDLLESGEFARLHAVMIDPDVRKIPSQRHRERELRDRLRATGFRNYAMEEDVMIGETHRLRIQNWLRSVGAEEHSPWLAARQAGYVLREAFEGRREPLRTALSGRGG